MFGKKELKKLNNKLEEALQDKDQAIQDKGRAIQEKDEERARWATEKARLVKEKADLQGERQDEDNAHQQEISSSTNCTNQLLTCRGWNASLRAEKDEQLPKKLTAELGKRVTSSDTWKTLAKIGKHGSRISVVAPNSEPRHPLRVPGGLVAPSTVQAEQMASEEARAAEAEQRREAEIEAAKKPPTLRMGWNLDRSAVAGFDTPSGFRPLPVRNSRGGGRRRYKSKKRLRARKKLSIRLHKQRNKRQTKKRQTKRRQTKRRH